MKRPPYYSYAFALLGLSLTGTLFASYSSFYFIDVLGMSVAFAAITKFIIVIFDTFNDLIAGYLSDNTKSRFGRRLPWLFIGAPLLLLTGALTFAPSSGLTSEQLFPYFLSVSIVYELMATIVYVNYGALFPTLFQGDKVRIFASMTRQGLSLIGMGIGLIVPPLLFVSIGYSQTAILFALTSGVIFFVSLSRMKIVDLTDNEKRPRIQFIPSLKELFKHPHFIFFSLASATILSVNALLINTFPFYTRYVLQADANTQSFLLLALFITALLSMLAWKKVINTYGLTFSWTSVFALYGLGMFFLAFSHDTFVTLLGTISIGMALAGILVQNDLIMAHIIDDDIARNHINREAIFYAINNFIQKFSLSFTTILFTSVGLAMGYVSGNDPGPNPELTFRILIGALPFGLVVIGLILSMFFHKARTKNWTSKK